MPKINPIPPKELEKIIINLWFSHIRTNWSHKFFFNKNTWCTTVIPFHGNEDISIWLLKKILNSHYYKKELDQHLLLEKYLDHLDQFY